MKITYKVEDGYKSSSVIINKDGIKINFNEDDSMEITVEERSSYMEKFEELNKQINCMQSNINTLLERTTIQHLYIK